MDVIRILGARQHNLKNIDLELPRNKMIVITGLSGSGKSTLAFDTIYAEGQRRYVESLSAYARQFLERMDKPDADAVEGLSPAIAIQQRKAGHNPRSTVGTVTEIHDFLRLLYARIGVRHCHQCDAPIPRQTLDQAIDRLMALPEGARIIILSPLPVQEKGAFGSLVRRLKKDGFSRVRADGEILDIEDLGRAKKRRPRTLEAVVDRLIVKPHIRNRLADSLELALALSEGGVLVDIQGEAPLVYNETPVCPTCRIPFPDLTAASFSFNSPRGACPACNGLGAAADFDPDRIVPNPNLSLREGAVSVWAHRHSVIFMEFLEALTRHYGADIYTPFKDLDARFQQALLYGSGDAPVTFYYERHQQRRPYKKVFEGVIPRLKRRYAEATSAAAREEIERYITFRPCPECRGSKLNPASRAVRVGGRTIAGISAMNVAEADRFFRGFAPEGKDAAVAERILKEISDRLGFMINVGLSYLTLDRTAASLSGGESQRLRLATQIGSRLTGVLYVLDEPSVGLHQRDNRRLIDALKALRDLGNTILVVEHDEEAIRSADVVVDMGPGAGVNGGEVIFSGPPSELVRREDSLTGLYLSGKRRIETPDRRRAGTGRALVVKGARQNNLKGMDVAFPLGCFICVTGVSGSGKSTLVIDTLYRALSQRLYRSRTPAGKHDAIQGLRHVDKAINIDQSPIGQTPRSNPGTYSGIFGPVRDLFSKTPEARMRGYKPGRFSFNVKGGRCEACKGDGVIKIEMHFLPDVFVTCDACRGRRYNRETLEVRYKGRTIADVMDMTVNQCMDFFIRHEGIRSRLKTLADVGLGYLRLGQSGATLSGGEAQRVKLSRELGKKDTGKTVYILDEPTTGLHFEDVKKLLEVLNALVDRGNTVIVIEHNLDVVKTADHVIDMGPEGGDEGGRVAARGTPEAVAETSGSCTGAYLKAYLNRRPPEVQT